jgi:hypothetical protein
VVLWYHNYFPPVAPIDLNFSRQSCPVSKVVPNAPNKASRGRSLRSILNSRLALARVTENDLNNRFRTPAKGCKLSKSLIDDHQPIPTFTAVCQPFKAPTIIQPFVLNKDDESNHKDSDSDTPLIKQCKFGTITPSQQYHTHRRL